MKKIVATRNIGLDFEEGGHMDHGKLRELADGAYYNRLAVIEGALAVENLLSKIICHIFLGPNYDRKEMFDNMILRSDWCSFSAKRKLLEYIINKEGLINRPDRDRVFRELRDVMSLRNAFAHGRLFSDGKTVLISYFEGTPKKQELTDAYLTEVETKLQAAFDSCTALAENIGAIKSSLTKMS